MFQIDGRINAHARVPNNGEKIKVPSIPLLSVLYKTSQTSHLIKKCQEIHATEEVNAEVKEIYVEGNNQEADKDNSVSTNW